MSDINRVVLIGRLTADPSMRSTNNGSTVCGFSIANNLTYSTGGEKKEQASFFSCSAWGKTGEAIAQYCKKGHRIAVEGRLQQRSWETQSGEKRHVVEIVVEQVQFLQPQNAQGNQDGYPPNS